MAGRFTANTTSENMVIGCCFSNAAKIKGHPLLAYLMGHAPQMSVFRRFSVAALKNLLFLQHEIRVLELQLEQAEGKDSCSSDPDIFRSNFDFRYMKNRSGATEKTQYELRVELKDKLKEYEEGILRYRQLASYSADKSQIKQIQLWLAAARFCDQTLSGVESDIWGSIEHPDNYAPDLIPLCAPISENRGHFAQWFNGTFIRWFHQKFLYRFKKPDADGNASYSAAKLNVVSSSFDFLICIVLIYLGMYVQGSKSGQELVMMLFTAAISVLIALFRNHQLFVIVPALAALFVEVLDSKHK